jgi:hypothetical protein
MASSFDEVQQSQRFWRALRAAAPTIVVVDDARR